MKHGEIYKRAGRYISISVFRFVRFKASAALVLARLIGDDLICCQITSQFNKDEYSISLTKEDFIKGSLPVRSMIRPNRVFTVDRKESNKKGTSGDGEK